MARRKSVGVSLFSFQDIITSVTAIIILVLLLLTLELLFRKYGLAASDTVRTQVELMDVEDRLNELVQSLEEKLSNAESAGGQSISPTKAELRRTLSALQSKKRRAEQEQVDANQVLIAAERNKQEALLEMAVHQGDAAEVESLEQDTAAKRDALQELQEANKSKKKDLKDLEEQSIDDEGVAMELVFNKPENASKQPWILDVFGDGLASLKLGSGVIKKFEIDSPGTSSDLDNWLAALSVGQNYILVMIRPSGVRHEQWVKKAIQDQGIPLGVELIGEDQEIRDGSAKKGE